MGEQQRVGDVAGQQAPDLAAREPEDAGGIVDADIAGRHVLEDEGAVLRLIVGGRVSSVHATHGDKVAGRLARIHRTGSEIHDPGQHDRCPSDRE
jgi:hypothetical protein